MCINEGVLAGVLDTTKPPSYNIFCAEVAQSVEQRTENPRVPSSILGLGTVNKSGSGSVVEHLLAKERVASSNLVFRSLREYGPEWRNR